MSCAGTIRASQCGRAATKEEGTTAIPLTCILSLGGERKYLRARVREYRLSPCGRGQGEGCRPKSSQAAKTLASSSTEVRLHTELNYETLQRRLSGRQRRAGIRHDES